MTNAATTVHQAARTSAAAGDDHVLKVRNLSVEFRLGRHRRLVAVDDISFDLGRGETLGLVGESGCGKSTTARAILRLTPMAAGRVVMRPLDQDGRPREVNLDRLHGMELRKARRHIQMVFQDPFASLNPRMTVGQIIAEPMRIFRTHSASGRRQAVQSLMREVGLDPAHILRYPHEFSGGQRQRIGIARALALNPQVLICDEPVSALDVSVRSQVLNLLLDLQEKRGLSYLFIAHDLSVVKRISHRVAVMYLGKIVEVASSDEIYSHPKHPYTQALLSAIPIPDPQVERRRQRTLLKGDLPGTTEQHGCPFASRCPQAMPACPTVAPLLVEVAPTHQAACLLYEPSIPPGHKHSLVL